MSANAWVVMDQAHSELIGEFESRAAAVAELRRLALLPWDGPENLCPCMSWQTCGRVYTLHDSAVPIPPWPQEALRVSAAETRWLLADRPD